MKINSYSKINLFLLVGKKNKNGLHKIKSLFFLNKNLYDEIKINKSNLLEIKYYLNNEELIIEDCNVQKILFFIKEKYKIDINYKISINKKIPLFSGLGGSASNAAYIAKYILDLYKINYENDYKLFINIGSDIPFFLSGYNCALVSQFGNKVTKKNIKNIDYKLIFNDINISTKDIYFIFDSIRKFKFKRNYLMQIIFLKFNLYKYLFNDLEEVILNNYDLINKKYNSFDKLEKIKIVGAGSTLIIFR